MQENTIEVDGAVLVALDPLRPERREEVLAEIFKLVEDPANRRLVTAALPSRTLYAADTPSGLRVFFRIDEDDRVTELVDLFRPSTWQGPDHDSNSATVSQ